MKNPRNNSFKSYSEGFSLLPAFRFIYLISPIEIKTNVAELESTAPLSRLARKENSLASRLMLMHEKSPCKISIYQARLKGTQQRSSLPCTSYLVPLFVLRSAVIKKIAFGFRCHGTENLQRGEASAGVQLYMEISISQQLKREAPSLRHVVISSIDLVCVPRHQGALGSCWGWGAQAGSLLVPTRHPPAGPTTGSCSTTATTQQECFPPTSRQPFKQLFIELIEKSNNPNE